MYEDDCISPFLFETTFCDAHNQDNCIMYLSKELVSLGLSPLYKNGVVQCDQVKLINTIYLLLSHFSSERNNQEELQSRILRLNCDLETLRTHHSRLQERLDSSEKNAQNHQEKHRQLALKNKNLQSDLKTEREECRRLQSMLQQREAQYQHEQRRRERELCQLKERLHQAMSQKTPQQGPAITLANGLLRQDGRRGMWTTRAVSTKNEDDLQKRIVSGYEQRNKRLLEDNTSLQELTSTLYAEFNLLRNQNKDDPPDKEPSTETTSSQPQSLFKAAGGINSEKVKSTVLESWHFLKNKWQSNHCKCQEGLDATSSSSKLEHRQKTKPERPGNLKLSNSSLNTANLQSPTTPKEISSPTLYGQIGRLRIGSEK